jgi:isopropylmalate/homocitrate/citramalate synthase
VFEHNPTTVFPVHPDFIGHEKPRIVMGKKSGLDNVALWTKKLNINLTEDEAMAVLKEVKRQSHDMKRVLTEQEFQKICEARTGKR